MHIWAVLIFKGASKSDNDGFSYIEKASSQANWAPEPVLVCFRWLGSSTCRNFHILAYFFYILVDLQNFHILAGSTKIWSYL